MALSASSEIKRIPVTQEYMVEMIVSGASHPAEKTFQRALYDSIIRMVIGIANGYAINSRDEADDLVQECMKRIMKKLHKYNSAKAKFSTWAYRVSKSVLDRKYVKDQGNRKTFVQMKEGWDSGEREMVTSSVMNTEISDVVRELITTFPKKRHILFAMFGDPDSRGFILPDAIDVSDVARRAGTEYGTTHAFYSRKVRPFFRKKFSEEDFHARV